MEEIIQESVCGELLQFRMIRSSRKTLGLEVRTDGSLVIRAPLRMSKKKICEFIRQKETWIYEHRKTAAIRQEKRNMMDGKRMTDEEKQELAQKACVIIAEKVSFFAQKMGVTYGKITIRDQKTRWGSCSSKGNLNFNFRLLLAPEKVLDYVVVHELCHRKQMNHSEQFWAEVEAILPDYRIQMLWLKHHGWELQQN